MGLPVAVLLHSITAYELSEWMVYFSLDPFGEKRADMRMAILASVIANKPVYGYKQPRAVKPERFMPDFEGSKRIRAAQQWRRDLQALKSFAMVHNARMELKNRNAD